MRRLFIVLAKIVGLLQVYWGLAFMSSIGIVLSQASRFDSTQPFDSALLVLNVAGFSALFLGMAWLLLGRTEWVADRLKIPADDTLPTLSDDTVLYAGIKIVGLYMLCASIPALCKTVNEAYLLGRWTGYVAPYGPRLIPELLKFLLALFLMLRTRVVLRLLTKADEADRIRIFTVVVALLGAILLLGYGLKRYADSRNDDYFPTGGWGRYPSSGKTIIEKGPNVPDHRDWYTVPYLEPIASTNDMPVVRSSNIEDLVNVLIEGD